jgi:hypothetical protein
MLRGAGATNAEQKKNSGYSRVPLEQIVLWSYYSCLFFLSFCDQADNSTHRNSKAAHEKRSHAFEKATEN